MTREQCQKCEGKGYRLDHAPNSQHSKYDGACLICPVTVVCDECGGRGHDGPVTREQEIQARLDAATPGERQASNRGPGSVDIVTDKENIGRFQGHDGGYKRDDWVRDRNADCDLILHAFDDLRYLLAENARLRQTVATFDYMRREGVTQDEALESWLDISSENARLREQVENLRLWVAVQIEGLEAGGGAITVEMLRFLLSGVLVVEP